MTTNKKSDVVLVVAIAGLGVLAMIPEQNTDESVVAPIAEVDRPEKEPDPVGVEPLIRDNNKIVDKLDETLNAVEKYQSEIAAIAAPTRPRATPEKKFAPPNADTKDAALISLIAGATWRYQVHGDESLTSGDTWTMRLVSEPEGSGPGIVETLFGEDVQLSPIYNDNGSIRFNGIPFVEPAELLGTRTISTKGELLPPQVRLIEGAVWTDIHHRVLRYGYRDKKGRHHELEARAVIRNRAHANGFETVIVPAGRFGAYRIEWLTRVDIEAEGRPILEHLTTEPFRRETMWVAPGVGIVKRNIDYLAVGRPSRTVTLSLTDYTPAGDCVFQDL
jgi:hypothetical protein